MLCPHFMGLFQKGLPLHQPVADDAGIGRQPHLILLHKIIHHMLAEFLFKIQHLKGDTDIFRHTAGIGDGFFAALPGPHFHGHTNDLIALFLQEICRHGAVHTAAEAYDDFSFFHFHSPLLQSSFSSLSAFFSLSRLSFLTSFRV